MEALKAELSSARAELKSRDAKWRHTVERLKQQVASATQERDELQREVAYLEQCRLNKWLALALALSLSLSLTLTLLLALALTLTRRAARRHRCGSSSACYASEASPPMHASPTSCASRPHPHP